MILTIRTDRPEAEIGFFDPAGRQLHYFTWLAHRQLATTLLSTILQQLQALKKEWADVSAIVVFEGPGSFTGLRIGVTVANTLAYGLQVAIVGSRDENWIANGISCINYNTKGSVIVPFYGGEAHITPPKK